MDDNSFDRELKKKLGEYEATEFDPAALAALHHQMASVYTTPWHAIYKTELIVGGSVLLATLLLIWSQWLFTHKSTEFVETKLLNLEAQLENTVQHDQSPKHTTVVQTDTIRILNIHEESSAAYASLLQKIDRLETALKLILAESSKGKITATLPEVSLVFEKWTANSFPHTFASPTNRITPHTEQVQSKRAVAPTFSIGAKTSGQNLSAKTILDIQKHYQKGVGFRLAPTALLSRASYTVGDGRYDFGVGILADFILSPSLSLETGIVHTLRHYHIPRADISEVSNIPGIESSLGELKAVDIDSWVFETPINLKYRYPMSMKSSWIASLGYSHLFYTKQILEYDYEFTSNQSASLNSSYKESGTKAYPGTLNLSLGFSNELKNNQFLETSIFYQHGVGKSGVEQTKPGFLGIRGAYWFTLK